MAQAGSATPRPHRGIKSPWVIFLLVVSATLLAPSASASAELAGNYGQFTHCPYRDPEASKCFYATTEGGEVILGSTTVPILNSAIVQGAYSSPDKDGISKFIGATNGITLSRAPQPVPGGLGGIAAPADASRLIKAVIALVFENDLTKVDATLELARPPGEIAFSEENFGGEQGPALRLPVKVHLKNPLLGSSCYVGSSSDPIIWNLTSGTTTPSKPGKPVKGTAGEIEFLEEGGVIKTKGTKLVDNAWSTPAAHGCGGLLSSLITPMVNASVGLPTRAGASTAILENAATIAPATTVKEKATE